MRLMSDQHINWLETQLEQLVEGAFTNLFGRRISTHDIALQLSRSMEDNRRSPQGSDPRPIAPDIFRIHLQTTVEQQLRARQPDIETILSQHMIELARQLGYRLLNQPRIVLQPDQQIERGSINVDAHHTENQHDSTAIMEPIKMTAHAQKPNSPQLVINGQQSQPLEQGIINIGRSHDNEIILDDNAVSRHHLQLRLRFGSYTLFDIPGKNTTRVNNVVVSQHPLQSGDVIRIGSTQLVYLEDNNGHPDQNNTDVFDPIQP